VARIGAKTAGSKPLAAGRPRPDRPAATPIEGGDAVRRAYSLTLLVFGAFALTAFLAVAQSPHGEPVCTISGPSTSLAVSCTGTLAGLGNAGLGLDLSVSGFALCQCQNQRGNIAPGENRVLVGRPRRAPR
jgi:hypothetical protein